MNTSAQSALLIVDVQQALFQKSTPVYGAASLLEKINALVQRAHAAGALVVYIQHDDGRALARGSDGWQLHADLRPSAKDLLIEKQHPSAFDGTALHATLQARSVRHLVVTGMVTHGCVRATCLAAHKLGYAVTLAADGHSSYNKDAGGLIAEWNGKLGALGIAVHPAAEILFGSAQLSTAAEVLA